MHLIPTNQISSLNETDERRGKGKMKTTSSVESFDKLVASVLPAFSR
jgi:hypothetical protein